MSTANTGYQPIYRQSLEDPETFWAEVAQELDWIRPHDRVLETDERTYYRWFVGGQINTCYNCVDRHVKAGHGDRLAIIHDSPITASQRKITYAELQDLVSRFAGVLRSRGVEKGDRVIIYMPMVPEALVAMLACARLGAIHSVVFGGFASNELATRINDCTPKVIVASSCGIEPGRVIAYKPLIDKAIEMAVHKPQTTIILAREQAAAELVEGRDFDWATEMASAESVDCVPVEATDPLYILYTSGTTGQPKGVVRDNGGHAAALLWSMKYIYAVEPGDVYWAASDVGWVVGHSYICYAPLLNGNTTIVYEGKPVGTPDAGAFWRVISEHGVKVLFTAPTAFRAIKKEDPEGRLLQDYDLSRFERLYLAGERCDPDTLLWAEKELRVPVIDHWWQTETGWSICANPMGIEPMPIKPGSPTVPMPGYDVQILDEEGLPVSGHGDIGAIVVKLPLPPSCLPTLWHAEARFHQSYLSRYPGYYLTGDAGFKDEDGYLYIMSRIDDIINVAGHRLSTGGMEEVLAGHHDVAECAVLGVNDQLKGELPMGFVVLKSGVDRPAEEIVRELITKVRNEIGPVAAFKLVAIVGRLPKTRSGKILRGTMKAIADDASWKMPATIDDPAILDEIAEALRGLGYAHSHPTRGA
ncbi:MAG: propionyl-CoA synthetase [Geminicoccaceae bacterium]|nr:propionyl-CoA synthetase [Geminicoccaceae bacterium]